MKQYWVTQNSRRQHREYLWTPCHSPTGFGREYCSPRAERFLTPANCGTIAPEVSEDSYVVVVIESRRTELDQICRHRGVRRLELFGSAARDDFTPTSDLDFLVEFSGSPSLTDYLGFREDLKLLFGREVDLVMPAAVRNPYIRATIERDRQLLYAA
jgi:predicted nucleotidyltransferase